MKRIEPLNISIPAAIACLANLTLHERVALAHIHNYPGSSNAVLARLLGISVRGTEDLLKRLRQQGYIKLSGVGRARTHQLTFQVPEEFEESSGTASRDAPTQNVGESQSAIAHVICDQAESQRPVRQESTLDFYDQHMACAKNCREAGDFNAAVAHFQLIRERMLQDVSLPPESLTKVLAHLIHLENSAIAAKIGLEAIKARKVPWSKQEQLALLIAKATPEKLAQIRQRYDEQKALGDGDVLEVLALPSI